ncbi:hypothetical protein DFH06DRAFT_1320678 [Mycena polygramma]|nr:hypothetical protein DFH06DRAFT_1320678 [Mycena polygramma]
MSLIQSPRERPLDPIHPYGKLAAAGQARSDALHRSSSNAAIASAKFEPHSGLEARSIRVEREIVNLNAQLRTALKAAPPAPPHEGAVPTNASGEAP